MKCILEAQAQAFIIGDLAQSTNVLAAAFVLLTVIAQVTGSLSYHLGTWFLQLYLGKLVSPVISVAICFSSYICSKMVPQVVTLTTVT